MNVWGFCFCVFVAYAVGMIFGYLAGKEHSDKERRKQMTREKYYALLKKKISETNFDNLESIKEYNRYAMELRKQIETEE